MKRFIFTPEVSLCEISAYYTLLIIAVTYIINGSFLIFVNSLILNNTSKSSLGVVRRPSHTSKLRIHAVLKHAKAKDGYK